MIGIPVKLTNRALSFAVAIAASAACPAVAQPSGAPSKTSVEQIGTSIRDRFVRAAKECGANLPFEPSVKVDTGSAIDVHYSQDDRAIHFTDWKNLDQDSRGAITAWAAKGTLGLGPEDMYREMFNSFIAPHELGHYLQHIAGRWNSMSPWDAELEANRIGMAFWVLQPGAESDVEARVANITRFLNDVPSPVPPEQDAKAFFNANYAAFSAGKDGPLNPMNYSWFQAEMMKTALRERAQYPFCKLVKINKAP